ncbi:hypothetical protein EC991_010151, partial [Linnemannia zychae]
ATIPTSLCPCWLPPLAPTLLLMTLYSHRARLSCWLKKRSLLPRNDKLLPRILDAATMTSRLVIRSFSTSRISLSLPTVLAPLQSCWQGFSREDWTWEPEDYPSQCKAIL